jgi:hypothetical protein
MTPPIFQRSATRPFDISNQPITLLDFRGGRAEIAVIFAISVRHRGALDHTAIDVPRVSNWDLR